MSSGNNRELIPGPAECPASQFGLGGVSGRQDRILSKVSGGAFMWRWNRDEQQLC